MANTAQLATHMATVVLNLAVALAVGAATASITLSRSDAPWAARQCSRLRIICLAGLATAMCASAWRLLFDAAAMAEVPLAQAGAAAWLMLTATHLGTAWTIGIGALALSLATAGLGAMGSMDATRRRWPAPFILAGLAVFFYTRSMVSHAASEGDFSAAMLADWLHLAMISLWLGEVVVAGAWVLAAPVGARADDNNATAPYIASLSTSATFALAAIVATGVFSAWHNLGSVSALTGNPYGETLLIKVGLVGVAVLMGGYNRVCVMPSLLDDLRRNHQAAAAAQMRRFTVVVRLESAVLLGVLILAAFVSTTSPPGAA